jgi:hypothetical protein
MFVDFAYGHTQRVAFSPTFCSCCDSNEMDEMGMDLMKAHTSAFLQCNQYERK